MNSKYWLCIFGTVLGFFVGFVIYPHQTHSQKEEENYELGLKDGYFQAIEDIQFGNYEVNENKVTIYFDSIFSDSTLSIIISNSNESEFINE